MVLLFALLALVIWASVATIVEIRRDGYRRQPTDWAQVACRDALDRAEAGHVYH